MMTMGERVQIVCPSRVFTANAAIVLDGKALLPEHRRQKYAVGGI
jgi:hypothetical protein